MEQKKKTKKTEERLTEKGLTSSSSKGLESYRPAITESRNQGEETPKTTHKKNQTLSRESEGEKGLKLGLVW